MNRPGTCHCQLREMLRTHAKVGLLHIETGLAEAGVMIRSVGILVVDVLAVDTVADNLFWSAR